MIGKKKGLIERLFAFAAVTILVGGNDGGAAPPTLVARRGSERFTADVVIGSALFPPDPLSSKEQFSPQMDADARRWEEANELLSDKWRQLILALIGAYLRQPRMRALLIRGPKPGV